MRDNDLFKALMILVILSLSACEKNHETTIVKPAIVKNIKGSTLHAITLSGDAYKRLDVQIVSLSEINIQGKLWKIVPYSAVLYDPQGKAWVYQNFNHLSFIRVPIMIAAVSHDKVFLSDGPPVGTPIVFVGAAELYGSEYQGIIQP